MRTTVFKTATEMEEDDDGVEAVEEAHFLHQASLLTFNSHSVSHDLQFLENNWTIAF